MKTAEQAASDCGNAMCDKYDMTIDYAIPCEDAFLMGVEFGRKAITEQEQHKSKGNEYVRKDLALEFATRFYQIMTSARVDEYIGARKDVCVNDLFEEFLKTKEDE